jgi:hypothetical protein
LDVRGLLDVSCKTVANMIKGKSPEEIRRTFNIKNDFTPDEEEQIRRENAWCEDWWSPDGRNMDQRNDDNGIGWMEEYFLII